MAERRMFSKAIIGSARFLMMPASTRLLYYDLGMFADDDGVVEAFAVLRQTNASEDDLRLLVAKGFIRVLNEELVTFITDWKTNNFIRSDRYKPSIYKDLLIQFDDSGIPTVDQGYTQYRLGKDSIGKDRIDKSIYGEFQNVRLTDEEYQKLVDRFPMDCQDKIENLSQYIAQKGKKYKSHYATILAWERKNNKTKAVSQTDRLGWLDDIR